MIAIGDILPVSRIELDVDVSSKKRLFEYVAQLLETDVALPHADIFDCLFARERLGSTGLGQGVAIPHGRAACVQTVTGAFVRLREAVDFDAPDGKPVALVFVLLVPEAATSEHLEILSQLAERFSDKTARDALLNSQNVDEVRALLVN